MFFKMKERNPNRDPIRSVLHEWKIDQPLPHDFKGKVWERIVRAEKKPEIRWLAVLRESFKQVTRPAVAASYLAVVIAAGMTAGYRHAQEQAASTSTQLSVRYLQTVDPYQTPR